MVHRQAAFALSSIMASGLASSAVAQESGDLAKAAQNPVAAMISLPFQNNTLFGVGPDDDTANVLNIQPVIPFTIGDWNIINRTIVPVIYLPDVTSGLPELPEGVSGGETFGLGDINYSIYFSPAEPGPVIWGVGPSLSIPTATDKKLGTQKWSAGPAAVALAQPGPWVLGSLVRQLWSFAGDSDRQDVSQLLIQPFVNYNMADGWYLVSSPIVTANWKADSDNTWTVPVGGGFGKIFRIGNQPINAQLQGFYNVEHPQFGPEWIMRFQLQFLFPKCGQTNVVRRTVMHRTTPSLAAIFVAFFATTAATQESAAPPLVEQINGGNWLDPQEAQELRDELFYQRAIHAYMTMLPALNVIGMRDGSEAAFGAGYNVLPIWKDRMDSRAWVPTPNADVIYSMSYLDLKETGPLVVARRRT